MVTTRVAVAPMKVAQVLEPGGDFEIVEGEIPKPGAGDRCASKCRPVVSATVTYSRHLAERSAGRGAGIAQLLAWVFVPLRGQGVS